MTDSPPDPKNLGTRLAHAGRDRKFTGGGVNPQVQRVSTVIVEKAEQLYAPGTWTYGRHGSSTHEALKQALCEIEDASWCAVVPSGLLACTLPIFALASPGGHILVTDNVYGPTRRFCDRTLKRWGCEVEYFDPMIGAGISRLVRPDTQLVFLESPGSMTFEIGDTPAIAAVARAAAIPTIMDNTWAAGVYHRPLDLGVDISVQSTSKYVGGAADLLGGAIVTRDDKLADRMKIAIADLGLSVTADDAYLVLRGLRTLTTRMDRHQASGLDIAAWLATRPEVRRVLHPGLAADPHHALWKRDFTGAAGLFGFVLNPVSRTSTNAFLDALTLFGLGFSYGGFESLAILCDPQLDRTVSKPDLGGPLIRLSIGLEDPADLKADLERAFAALG